MATHSAVAEDNTEAALRKRHEILTGQLCVACGTGATAETSAPVETPALVEAARVVRRHLICPIPDRPRRREAVMSPLVQLTTVEVGARLVCGGEAVPSGNGDVVLAETGEIV